jgi:hypothetical protein
VTRNANVSTMIRLCAAMCMGAIGICANPAMADAQTPPSADAVAKHAVQSLVAGDFAQAELDFTDRMKSALPPDQLKDKWGQRVGANNAQIGEMHDTPFQQYTIVWVKTVVGPDYFWTKVVVDSSEKVAGLQFAPSSARVVAPGA